MAKAKFPKGKGQTCYAGAAHVVTSIQLTLSASWMTEPFADVVVLDIEKAAIESSIIDLGNKEIEVY